MLENGQIPAEGMQSSDLCAEILHEEEASMANAAKPTGWTPHNPSATTQSFPDL
jgi:hypothetical protein